MKFSSQPPKWADRFLEWYCATESIEEIQGDAHELFQREVQTKGIQIAKKRFVWNVVKHLRWSNIKNKNSKQSLNSFGMWKNYTKTGLRNIIKNKSHSFVNLVSLAVGLSAFILISLYVKFEYSFDTYHENSDDIYRLVAYDSEGPGIAKVSGPVGPAVKESISEVKTAVRFSWVNTRLFEYEDIKGFETSGLFTDPDVFQVFGYKALEGNLKEALSAPNSIVITKSLADKYFNNESALGKILSFNKELELTVTAVIEDVPLNSHFHFSYLLPIEMDNRGWIENWQRIQYYTYLQLDENADPAAVIKKIPAVFKSNIPEDDFADLNLGLQKLTSIHLKSDLFRELGRNSSETTVYFYSMVALLILLIACANFTNILTAKATERMKEVSVRKTMGAIRGQLISQFIFESGIMVILSTLVALGASFYLLPYLNSITGTGLIASDLFNWNFILVISVIALVTIILSSTYPAVYLSSFNPISLVGKKRKSKAIIRNSLVIFQLAISTFLIISILVINIQQDFIQNKGLGYETNNIINIPIREQKNRENYQHLKERLENNKDIISTSVSGNMLGGGDYGFPVNPEGIEKKDVPTIRVLVVDESFLKTFEMDLVDGMGFNPANWGEEKVEVIINQEAAKQLGWNEAVGKEMGIRIDGIKSSPVVGVLNDFHFRSLHEEIQPILLFTRPTWFAMISVKFNAQKDQDVIAFLQEEWKSIEPGFPFSYSFFEQRIEGLYADEARTQEISSYASIIAILIAIVGLISLTSYNIQKRTKEFSVRKVLGASITEITTLQLKQYLILAGISIGIGLPIAVMFSRLWMQNFAYKASVGAEVFIAGAVFTGVVVLFTVGILCVKASRANPVGNLRME